MPTNNTKLRNDYKIIVGMYQPTKEAVIAVEKQTCRNVQLIEQTDGTATELYNNIIKQQLGDIYAFIDGNCILEKNCIENIVNRFVITDQQVVGAVYTDCYIHNPDTNIKYVQYYPSYRKRNFHINIINPYVFINGGIITEIFNNELDILYFYDALQKISHNAIILHIPQPLYTTKLNTKDISKDLEKLQINVKR